MILRHPPATPLVLCWAVHDPSRRGGYHEVWRLHEWPSAAMRRYARDDERAYRRQLTQRSPAE